MGGKVLWTDKVEGQTFQLSDGQTSVEVDD